MLHVREAKDADAAVVAALRREWVEENERAPVDDPDYEAAFAQWCAAEGQHRVVYVRPPARGRGVGGALLEAAIEHADERRFARLVLSPSQRSVPLYARAGFRPATELMVRPGPVPPA